MKPKFTKHIQLVRGHWYGHYKAICYNYRGRRVEIPFTDSEIWDAWNDPDHYFYRDAHRIIYSRITKAYHDQIDRPYKSKIS